MSNFSCALNIDFDSFPLPVSATALRKCQTHKRFSISDKIYLKKKKENRNKNKETAWSLGSAESLSA